MTAITWKLGRLKLAEHLLREAARHLPRPLKRELDVFLAERAPVSSPSRPPECDYCYGCGELGGEHEPGCEALLPGALALACDEIEKLRVKVEQLQKRAGEWEQKDVVAFEKTITDLREKLAAVGSRVYGGRRHWKGRARRAERELESYAATDLTASMALADVTRERDDLQRQLDDARHDCGAPACTDDTPDEVCECGHAKSEHNHGQFSCWSNDDCKCVRYATPDPKPTDTTEMRRRADLYKYNPDDLRKFLLAACDALDEERLKNEARPREDMLIQHQIRKEG